ncbi:hypothetical protein OW763_07830 [Clostridium aestuarii]|uniref:DUF4825 domain-containing protein n=1 Tax=Clostridium aestuarii TaxID=338193 RepID=A0ABT4CZ56_9CLOT|nr:hypothetical protein [Clostridium aestuarii]MCY6484263.1 hypothetical protein [Clostridium aestuarii]
MKKSKIIFNLIFFSFIISIVYGVVKVNANLNRQIYLSVVGNHDYKNNKTKWELGHMQQILDSTDRYLIKDLVGKKNDGSVPKIKVLYNLKPFDFRIYTENYMFFINKDVISNINAKFDKFTYGLMEKVLKLIKIMEENLVRLV